MRDEQVRRYARHILLPDVGGLGQTALLVATAQVDVTQRGGMIAASYLAAGGTGTVIAHGAGERELTTLGAFNPDTKILREPPPARGRGHGLVPARRLGEGGAGNRGRRQGHKSEHARQQNKTGTRNKRVRHHESSFACLGSGAGIAPLDLHTRSELNIPGPDLSGDKPLDRVHQAFISRSRHGPSTHGNPQERSERNL